MRILFIPLEFPTWNDASHFPYPSNYGFEEGFEANGVEFHTIPALYGTKSSDPSSWLRYAREICSGVRFDQVWMEIVHSAFDDSFLAWIREAAPVRIGFLWESCEMDPRESPGNPDGARRRRENLERNLPAMTHVVAADEKDVDRLNSEGKVRAKWFLDAGIVPKRWIAAEPASPCGGTGVFYGALYGDRKSWLEHPVLKGLLVRPEASSEIATRLPRMFDELHGIIRTRLQREGAAGAGEMLPEYLDAVRTVRREAFSLWLNDLGACHAVVNLPQFGKVYAGRVLEGMAAGRPVVTWEIPDRPRTRALFRDGEEILLYPKDDPEALAAHLRRLRNEPELADRLARNAIRKLREGHTTELLVRQILAWSEGEEQAPRGTGGDRVRRQAPPPHSSSLPGTGEKVASSIIMEDTYRFYEENLLCPETHERLRYRGGFLESRSGKKYRMENGIPCFVKGELSGSQKSEFEFTENYIREIIEGKNTLYDPERVYAQAEVCWKWATPWINEETVSSDTRIICIGGSFVDDLPHVHSSYKFNIDHLAHRYFGIHPRLGEANTHYIASSAERLPFGDGFADIVYMRNSLDHTENPIKCLQEAHRVLKESGRLFLGTYYNSTFINEHESTVIDERFLSSCVDPLFQVEHRELHDTRQQRSTGGRKTGFLNLVCRKRSGGTLRITEKEIMTVEKILALFHTALYKENRHLPDEAADTYGEILPLNPVFPADVYRVVYAYIRWCVIRNPVVLPILYSLYRRMGFSALWEEVFLEARKGNTALLPASTDIGTDLDGLVKQLDISGKIYGWGILYLLALTMTEEGNKDALEMFGRWIPPGVSFQASPMGPSVSAPAAQPAGFSADTFLREATDRGAWRKGEPLRLHLGCGENRLEGYVNIDYPPSAHNVMRTRADVHANITELSFAEGTVDEVRLHHVFEHFNRVTALALLIRWHGWLKAGGKLIIETPDIVGSARTLLSDAPLGVKMGVVRHLAGDQAASWAYHVDHWFPERFVHTMKEFGYVDVATRSSSWDHPPYLSNMEVVAVKGHPVPVAVQLAAADRLLRESMVADSEKPTWEIWRRQLRDAYRGKAISTLHDSPPPPAQVVTPVKGAAGIVEDALKTPSAAPLDEIHNFNQRDRDRWVAEQARKIPAGAQVLDVGAGTCPYRSLFSHCEYRTHDFKKYEGEKLGGTTEYGEIDYVSEIDAIPVPEKSFDVVLCTEVLEHVPEPIRALERLSRILRPGGKLLITAPLGAGLHQLPFHFYGGYTPEWYRHFGAKFGLEVVKIVPNGGFFRLLAQECARVAWTFPQHAHLHGENAESVRKLFGETLPRYLYALDDKCPIDQFTVGYHVEMVRSAVIEKAAGVDTQAIAEVPGLSRVTAVVFSKDRPLQLDATLKSLFRFCGDASLLDIGVLYKTSSPSMEGHYATLRKDHPAVRFIPEKDFKEDLLEIAGGAENILFLVDDNLFVRRFEVGPAVRALDATPDALGFSMRLGRNTIYCYPLDSAQSLPEFRSLGSGILAYPWEGASLDFGYPLEVSSSIYRAGELLPLLNGLKYNNPNTLESALNDSRFTFSGCRPLLLTFDRSVAFCAPVNRVQDQMKNRAGGCMEYTPESLADLYGRGYRLDPDAYEGLIPEACHKEVNLQLRPPQGAEPLVSIVIPCYNQANYLPAAVESVVAQTYGNWEILIVNDGSRDGTSEVSRKLIERHRGKRIRLIEKTNGGLANARNTGVREASGEYILPLDSDDMIHPDMISKTVRALEKDRTASIAHVDTYMFGTVKQLVQKRPYDFRALCKENFMNYCSLYRKKAWEDVGGYNRNMERGYEDWDFWIGCGEKGHFAVHVPEPLFFYRVKEESMLTKAREHDLELRARIVLNHPSVYGRDEVDRAAAFMEGIREDRELRDGTSGGETL